MKGNYILILLLFLLISNEADAQLIKKAEQFLKTTFEDTSSDTLAHAEAYDTENTQLSDSIRLEQLTQQLEEMRLNEMLLRSQLQDRLDADSLRQAEQRHRIDSLRSVTPGVPVIVESDTLFVLYAARGGYSASDRAETVCDILLKIGKDRRLRRDSIYLLDNENFVDIMYGDKVVFSVTEMDALWHGTTPQKLAAVYGPIIDAEISLLKAENSFWQILKRAALFVMVLICQYLLLKFINYLFRRLREKIIQFKHQKMKPLVIREYELLNTDRLTHMLIVLSNFFRYIVLLLFLIFTVPILFSIFPQTEDLALKIFYYIVDPIKMVVKGILEYIPNLFIIAIIWYCVRYIVKGLHYISKEIKTEKLKITGFYPDWAEPTFNIIRFLLYAFMIAMIYPYLPGSESGVFQGISVFVGLIVSLGSSTVISNFIAGFVITYMRPFKTGDFIKVNDTVGNVIEKSPFVTRVRTIKNEVVTIPNSFIISSNTVNYSASARKYGLIIHTMLTMGYDVPWRKVHQLLIDAALDTPGVLKHPQPFVLETELNDNYMCYQINAYIKNADDLPVVMSDLLQNIQDYFNDAGIELFAPHHFSTREWKGPQIVVGS